MMLSHAKPLDVDVDLWIWIGKMNENVDSLTYGNACMCSYLSRIKN